MYYTIPEAMKIVKVSQRTLYTWIETGKLPIIKIGKVTRIDEKDLEEFMQSHKIRRGQTADDAGTPSQSALAGCQFSQRESQEQRKMQGS